MVLESLLAVLALCVAGAAAAADGTAATGTPFQIFSAGVAGFLEMFGIPVYVAQCFMTMCVSAMALTSLDSVARIGRMSFQHLASVRKRKPAVKRTGSDHSVRILKSNRKREQDSVPTTAHHALRNLYCTG